MAGVLLHLAMGDPQKTDSDNTAYNASCKKAYMLGLLLPDIVKRGFIMYMKWDNIRKCTDYFRRQRTDTITGGWQPEEVWADR